MNKNLAFFLVLVMLLTGVLVYFWAYNSPPPTTENNMSDNPLSDDAGSANIAEWKWYRDDLYGFAFQHPKDLFVTKTDPFYVRISKYESPGDPAGKTSYPYISLTPQVCGFAADFQSGEYLVKSLDLGGISATYIDKFIDGNGRFRLVHFEKWGVSCNTIRLYVPPTSDEYGDVYDATMQKRDTEIQDKIVSTLKFLR